MALLNGSVRRIFLTRTSSGIWRRPARPVALAAAAARAVSAGPGLRSGAVRCAGAGTPVNAVTDVAEHAAVSCPANGCTRSEIAIRRAAANSRQPQRNDCDRQSRNGENADRTSAGEPATARQSWRRHAGRLPTARCLRRVSGTDETWLAIRSRRHGALCRRAGGMCRGCRADGGPSHFGRDSAGRPRRDHSAQRETRSAPGAAVARQAYRQTMPAREDAEVNTWICQESIPLLTNYLIG